MPGKLPYDDSDFHWEGIHAQRRDRGTSPSPRQGNGNICWEAAACLCVWGSGCWTQAAHHGWRREVDPLYGRRKSLPHMPPQPFPGMTFWPGSSWGTLGNTLSKTHAFLPYPPPPSLTACRAGRQAFSLHLFFLPAACLSGPPPLSRGILHTQSARAPPHPSMLRFRTLLPPPFLACPHLKWKHGHCPFQSPGVDGWDGPQTVTLFWRRKGEGWDLHAFGQWPHL